MIEIRRDILTDEQCQEIIRIAETRAKWNPVYQGYSVVDTLKVYIKPHIQHILKDIDLEIPEDCCVEVLKYRTGAANGLHIDAEGDHQVAETSYVKAEWKLTGVVLLNDDFEGGELFFPNFGGKAAPFDNSYKGTLVRFDVGNNSLHNSHGVTEVKNGTRYTLVFRYI